MLSENTPQLIGHDWALDQLRRALYYERIRHAYLLVGPESVGKSTLAKWLAVAVNCQSTENNHPCGHCRACKLIAAERHPDVSIVESESVGSTLKIEQIRALQQGLTLRPYEARYKVVIVLRFHEAQGQAQDALLKTLEEPAPNTLLILTATGGENILPTILSRCQVMTLRPASLAATENALVEHWQVEPEKARLLAHLSGGRLGWAIRTLENEAELESRREVLIALENSLGYWRRERFQFAEGLAKEGKKTALLTTLEYWQTYWRDVLLAATGSQTPLVNIDRQEQVMALAGKIGAAAAQKALEATRQTMTRLQQNANARLCLEVMFLDYPRVRAF